jgi:spermidine/putrescine-binding protein
MSMHLGRLTCHLFAVLIVLLALSLPAYAVETLRVLAWPGYADSDLVKDFERRFNVHVEVSFVGSDDVLGKRSVPIRAATSTSLPPTPQRCSTTS